ncbi:MAG TPA: twin-arginine translocation signal domain-containing protein, partial [Candidatus Hydrogenedentes bacterium]|nr:twin-arginine translocation signal domain-containing protein [Candidatus Hydrogenedentota bacterium]
MSAPENPGAGPSRRELLGAGAASAALLATGGAKEAPVPETRIPTTAEERRAALWRLLGDLPERTAP